MVVRPPPPALFMLVSGAMDGTLCFYSVSLPESPFFPLSAQNRTSTAANVGKGLGGSLVRFQASLAAQSGSGNKVAGGGGFSSSSSSSCLQATLLQFRHDVQSEVSE